MAADPPAWELAEIATGEAELVVLQQHFGRLESEPEDPADPIGCLYKVSGPTISRIVAAARRPLTGAA